VHGVAAIYGLFTTFNLSFVSRASTAHENLTRVGLLICVQGQEYVEFIAREEPQFLPNCSVSSDACGSLPVFDQHGKLLEYKVLGLPYHCALLDDVA
jgi:hypothetical protein